MIIADKKATIAKADEVAIKILSLITDEVKNFKCDDDPAEHAYLTMHIIGNLTSRICLILEGYSHVYGIEKMMVDSIHSWITEIAKEHIKFNKKNEK
jgi:hypothetical protein